MVASWWQHTALFLFLFDVKGRWAVFNNLETFLITDRAYQIDFYKNVGPRFNPGALNQHPRLLHGPPLATNSTSYALLPPTWPLMHFSHQLPNAFQRMRMMHRIIYVATNFLSKIAFFRDHGESSLSTLDMNPGSRDPLRELSGDPHLEPHFEESEELNAFRWIRMMHHRIIYVATNFLSKTDFFRDHGESSLSTLDVNPASRDPLRGLSGDPRLHFEESEESNAFQWCIESLTLPPISLIHRLFSWSGRIELINTWSEAWVKCPLLKGYQVPEFGTAHSISALRFWISALHSWFSALRFCQCHKTSLLQGF